MFHSQQPAVAATQRHTGRRDAGAALAQTSVAPPRAAMISQTAPLAATMRAPLKPQQESKQQSPPPAAALSSSLTSPLARTSNGHGGGAPSFLQASFQIGSVNGRMNFSSGERVFHRSDVPAAARAAVEEVSRSLRTGVLDGAPKNWDSSTSSGVAIRGSKHCSWETAQDTFDNRLYHAIDAAHRVGLARARIDTIRGGADPDFDPRNVQAQRWNISTFVPEKHVSALSAGRPATNEGDQPPREYKHLPEDYLSLIAKQRNLSLHRRATKASQAQLDAERAELQASWAVWARSAHVDGTPTHPQLDVCVRPDYASIAAAVEAEYGHEALTQFLWQQEHPEEAAAAGLPPLEPAPGSGSQSSASPSHSRYASSPTVHHSHRQEQFSVQEELPYSSSVPPAWYRAEARTKQQSQAQQIAPYPKFQHPGVYEWVAGSEVHVNGSHVGVAPPLPALSTGSAGAEERVSGGYYRWSCCLHPLRDTRGCQAVDVDQRKRRLVVARSDDPSSTAAWGLGSGTVLQASGGGAIGASHRSAGSGARSRSTLDASHVRARSSQALSALSSSLHSSPVSGGTAGVAARASGMGLSGPGVAEVLRCEHSGKYQLHAASGDAMWSCCGAADANEPGCVAKKITREQKWMLASP